MRVCNQISRSYILIIFLIFVTKIVYAEISYPNNPNKTDDAIYVSSSGVTAFNSDTLKPEWNSLNGINTFEPVIAQSVLLVGSSTGLHALDQSTGEIIWTVENSITVFTPVIDNGIAYAGSEKGILLAVHINSGTILWQKIMDGWIYTPVVFNDVLLVGGNSHVLKALDKKNGKIIWQKKIQQELVYSPVRVADQSAIVTTFDGTILKIKIQSGEIVWKIKDQVLNMSSVFINHALLLSTLDGRVRNIDIDTGKINWEFDIGGQPHISLESDNNIVAISDKQGQVMGAKIKSGEILWKTNYEGEIIGRPLLHQNQFLVFQYVKYNKNYNTAYIKPRKIH